MIRSGTNQSFCDHHHNTLVILLLLALTCLHWASATSIESLKFLQSYGYIPEPDSNGYSVLSASHLQKAIKTMQRYANIPQTGVLDSRTMKVMRLPRCGIPDVASTIHNRTIRHKRFIAYGPKWDKFPLTWSLTKSSRTVPTETARRVFHKAFDLWARASAKLKFIETGNNPKADILIGFYVGEHGDGKNQAFDGPGLKLAHAFPPKNGDVHFDDDEDWISEKNGVSLFWTALHEFGHSLGFAHTADESSIMFPYYQHREGKFELPETDKAGVRYLYGASPSSNSANSLPTPKYGRGRTIRPGSPTTTPSSREQEDRTPSPCNKPIDAIASIRGDIFIFKDNKFWWIKQDLELVRKEPIVISQYFSGFPPEIKKVDAVYERKSDHKIMFFVGKNYWLFSANQYYAGPKSLTSLGLPRHLNKVDAVTNWGHNQHAYIFAGPKYWRLNDREDHILRDYPRDMSVWKGVPLNIDSAFTWTFDSTTYFFKGMNYWKFDNQKMRTSPHYPKPIFKHWLRAFDCEPQNYKLRIRSVNAAHSRVSIQYIAMFAILVSSAIHL